MRAEERPTWSVVPRIAYLVSGSARDGAALRRTLRALYHLANTYVVHLDLEAPAAERAKLAAAVRADPVYARFRNVKVVTRANLVTYHGPTMVANTLHAAAILLRGGDGCGGGGVAEVAAPAPAAAGGRFTAVVEAAAVAAVAGLRRGGGW
jgi:beta-glucuronosyltransferase